MALSTYSLVILMYPFFVYAHARIEAALANINTDTLHPARGASVEDVQIHLRKRADSSSVIDSLWNAPSNQILVSRFLNNSFATTCAHSSDEVCLPLYQKYSVQDYFFLEDYVKYKSHRLITVPTGDLQALRSEATSVSGDADYAISAGKSYVTDLHGKATDLAEENRSIAELAYGSVLQNAESVEDWYNLHIISIPCIYGWTRLADKLARDPLTRKDTIFYKTWIEPNNDPSFATKLTAFLNANEAVWKDGIDTGTKGRKGEWGGLFRTALRLEIALFATAFEK